MMVMIVYIPAPVAAEPPVCHICLFLPTLRSGASLCHRLGPAAFFPCKDTPTCLPIFLKLCMLKTKPNGSLGISTGRANHCEH